MMATAMTTMAAPAAAPLRQVGPVWQKTTAADVAPHAVAMASLVIKSSVTMAMRKTGTVAATPVPLKRVGAAAT